MDKKSLILFFALSAVVLVGYYLLFPPPKQVEQTQQVPLKEQPRTQAVQTSGAKAEESTSGSTDIFAPKQETEPVKSTPVVETITENIVGDATRDIRVETELFTAVFTNKGAGLKSFILKKYKDDKGKPLDLINEKAKDKFGNNQLYPFYFSPFEVEQKKGAESLRELYLELNNSNFAYNGKTDIKLTGADLSGNEVVLEFKYADAEKKISVTKRFTIERSSYVMNIETSMVKNGATITPPILFGPDLENNVNTNRVMQSGLGLAAYTGDNVNTMEFSEVKTEEKINSALQKVAYWGNNYYWVAYETTYFAAIFKTHESVQYAVVKLEGKDSKKIYSYLIVTEPKILPVFIGPKDEQILAQVEQKYQFDSINRCINYGWSFFGTIARLLQKGVMLVFGFIPNMGWAVVIFTILIKIILFPLTYASSVSMAKMQTLQPKMNAIKKKYKNLKDPEQRKQMNIEIMGLYKQEKVNPAGGCIPMLLQLPILFAFFRLFPISINFRHEPWLLWLKDLSIKDPSYLLPILMGVTMMIVSKMSPTGADSGGMQKYMVYIMPIFLTFVCLNYSAGLNLYWFVSNFLQIGQQYIINKKIFQEKKDEEKEKKAFRRKKGGKAI